MDAKLIVMKKFLPYGLHSLDEDDIQSVIEALKSDWITSGPKVKEFEDCLCGYVGNKYGVAVNSGTSALDIAVASLGLSEGELITTPFTFVATANAILFNNLNPVFADIQRDTYNIDPMEIRKKITKNTRGIIYVDYAGQPCDIKEIKEIAEENDLYLIEDACHALGAEYNGKKIGRYADITIFSFHPVKLITTGEGGMAVTHNKEIADEMAMLRNHGIDKDAQSRFGPNARYAYDMKRLSRNYRMTDFQAALGISQLKKLDEFITRRKGIVQGYDQVFDSLDGVTTANIKPNRKSAYHLYTILMDPSVSRDIFFQEMRKLNIGVNVHYIPVYHHSYYQNRFHITPDSFPVTEGVFKRIVTLPLHVGMTQDDINYVNHAAKSVIKRMDH